MSDRSEPREDNKTLVEVDKANGEIVVESQIQEAPEGLEQSPTIGKEEIATDEVHTTDDESPDDLVNSSPWYIRYSSAIQAFAAILSVLITGVLAYYTSQSLEEVKSQREFAYRQFVITNEPSVRTYVDFKSKYECNDQYCIVPWTINNKGGPASDFKITTVLLHVELRQDSTLDFIRRPAVIHTKIHALKRDEEFRVQGTFRSADEIGWLNSCFDGVKAPEFLVLFTHVSFTVPSELSVNREPYRDESFNIWEWNSEFKKWHSVTERYIDTIHQFISAKGYIEQLN